MVKVGQIINVRGLKGECRIYPYTDEPEKRFQKGNRLTLDDGRELEIRQVQPWKNLYYIFFKEIDTIEKAEALKGMNLWIDESQLPELDEDEFYYHQLHGCRVYSESDEYLGEVIDILETGAHLNLRVSDGDRQFLLPFVDAFVREVDPEKKIMRIVDMEGLR